MISKEGNRTGEGNLTNAMIWPSGVCNGTRSGGSYGKCLLRECKSHRNEFIAIPLWNVWSWNTLPSDELMLLL